MAVHNEILTGRHNNFIRKLFGLKGRAPAPQLSSEISISHPIFHGQENRFLESWNLWGVGSSQLAAAALNSEVNLRNPANSRVVAVIVLFAAGVTAAGGVDFQFGQSGTDKANPLLPRALDGRVGTTARGPQCVATSGNSNVGNIGSTVARFQLLAATEIVLPTADVHEIVLSPGDQFLIQDRTQNDTMTFTLWWRERVLEEGELQ